MANRRSPADDPGSRRASAAAFDFDRVLAGRPEAKSIAEAATIAATVGEMIRNLRTAQGVSQTELARRVGSTQAHISEIERGIGRNGPTLLTLARIVSELGDTLIVDTQNRRLQADATTGSVAPDGVEALAPGMSGAGDGPSQGHALPVATRPLRGEPQPGRAPAVSGELARIEACIPALRRYAVALLGTHDEADDLVQECLVRALDDFHARREDDDVRAWLFTIMHNLFTRRTRRRRSPPLPGAFDDGSTAPGLASGAVPPPAAAPATGHQAWLNSLSERHAALEARISDEAQRPRADNDVVMRLKIEKLHVKEEIERLRKSAQFH